MSIKNQKEILFIGATHGDEPIGVYVLRKMEQKRKDFDWVIGNQEAFKIGERSFKANLNRSAPGDPLSRTYEVRRAAELIELSKKYSYTIDIHGTPKNTGVFIIITNPKIENWRLASWLLIKRIVFWPSFSPELQGPLSEYFKCGLEIECGPKELLETRQDLMYILETFLDNYVQKKNVNFESLLESKEIYQVYGSLDDDPGITLEEFKEVRVGGENFYPLLAGRYNKIYCYKMKKINNSEILYL